MQPDLELLRRQYGAIYLVDLPGGPVVFRPLSRQELREVYSPFLGEDPNLLLCQKAVVWPKYHFDGTEPAGLVETLSQHIRQVCLLDTDVARDYLARSRADMQTSFERQAEVVILTAFPQLTKTDLMAMTYEEFLDKLAEAEWALQTIHGKPFEFEESEPSKPGSRKEQDEALYKQGVDPMRVLPPGPKPRLVPVPFITQLEPLRRIGHATGDTPVSR